MSKRGWGKGSIYQRPHSAVWWISYSRGGRRFYESTHATNKRKAERLLDDRLAELRTGTFTGPEAERTRVDELADDLIREYRINRRKSLSDLETRWKLHLKPFFGMMRALDVSSGLLARYIDNRQQQNAKNATINRELAALKRMFRLGRQTTPAKVIHSPQFPRLEERNVRTGFLSDEQFTVLARKCASVGLWLRAMLEVGYTYGWRVEELKAMRVGQIDLVARVIRLEPGTTKNQDGREVTMTESVYILLSGCLEGKDRNGFVFTRADGKPVRDFRGTWQKVCNASGVPGLLFHDLRRTAARNLRRAGVAEGVIMKIGGWRTRSVFERYAIVTQSDVADAIGRLQSSKKSDTTLTPESQLLVQQSLAIAN